VSLIVGDLPNAVGSPDAAVVDYDGVFAFEIGGNVQRSAVRDRHGEVRKRITRI
jgi:hypothetical protein